MNQTTAFYLAALRQVSWQQPEQFTYPDENAKTWLLELGSLSHLMAAHCEHFSVKLLHNQFTAAAELHADEVQLLSEEQCLLRQVVLQGDAVPWALGSTLIPLSSMQQRDWQQQGDTPLGETIFSCETVKRDALQVGWAETSRGKLLARRSRLWMQHKPMLVAELFLPDSPIYSKERV
ncbi:MULTISPECIES: chorismate lyase [Vibrio]|uniref:Probable chorismate pyruvate-lyase n=1 Tax=Vibrio ostreae TaxID=2841925 RepID=A0A975YNC1_9VIBR|nr:MULTISPECIES: chorismate lyase [Vibrio]QXO17509.1 chorismate lyase [Vibrio ostreae]